MSAGFEDEIRSAIQTGRALALDFDRLIKIAKDPKAEKTEVEVTLGLDLSSVYQLAGIVQGADLLGLLPPGLLPPPAPKPHAPYVTLETVTVTLLTRTRTIGAVTCALGFGAKSGKGFEGLRWTIARIGTESFAVRVTGLNLGLDKPTGPDRSLIASSAGAVDVAKLALDVTGSYPDGRIEIAQPAGTTLVLADFLTDFGLHAQDFLTSLTLKDLDFVVAVPSKSGSIKARLVTRSGAALVLVQGDGARALLSLADASLDCAYSATRTDVAIKGQFLVLEALSFDVAASYKDDRQTQKGKVAPPGSTWVFAGALNVADTWKRLHPGQKPPPLPLIGIADLAELFVPGSAARLPAEIGHLSVAELSARYTRDGQGATAYRLKGAFDGTWQLAGGIHATLSIVLTEKHKLFTATFDMDGFQFDLSLDLTEGKDAQQAYTIRARIDAIIDRQPLKIAGSYDSAGKLALTLEAEVNLAMMIAWFVGSATGQRYYVLPEPWDDILKQIRLPRGLALAMDTKTGAVTVTLGQIGLNFLAFSIDGISLVYTRADATGGKSGITIELTGRLPGGTALSWDPATETPPEIPGKGGALVEIRTAAAGQHFAFDTVPTGIAEAVGTVGKSLAASSWTGPPALMHFDPNAGWLFAAHARILGQADLEFVFNDPDIYGVLITVTKGKNDKLNVLDGLHAEVLYRKVTDAVGVYEGTLTLPKSVQNVNFGAFEMTLPSFYLAIYTNGDFKIDVGFPHDLDFSKSLSLTVEIYSGAAGFYYAKLDGLDPKGLPQIPEDKGIFSPVTEIGIGLQVGIQKGFESGPLSARFAVMVQGLFQGTFATYHDFASGRTDEFYDVRATVAVFGQLVGAIDFAIIKAKLEVRIFVRADMRIVAHRATEVAFAAGVDVRVTVIINLFLFRISIHLSFSMVVHGAATFGQDTHALWDDTVTVEMAALAGTAPPPVWQPVAPTGGPVPLTVHVLPALSAGVDYSDATAPADRWIQVAQFGLSTQAAAPGTADAGDDSYAAFLTGLLRWGLFAASGDAQAGGAAADQSVVDKTTLTRSDIAALLSALARGDRPGMAEIRALFKAGFETRIGKPATPAKGQILGVGFFPALPGMKVTLTLGAGPATDLVQTPRTTAVLPEAPGALPSLALAHLGAPRPATPPASPVEEVLVDYVTLALRAGLQQAHDAAELFPEDGPPPRIAAILAALAPGLDGISGLTSRLMLHGTRQPAADGAMHPLYALTGQQAVLGADDMAADTLVLGIGLPAADQALWNARIEGGGASLAFSSADAEPLVKAPAALPAMPDLPDPKPALTLQPAFDIRPLRFALPAGISATGGGTVWRLPPGLTDLLSRAPSAPFGLFALPDGDPEAEGTPVPADDFNWALALDFDVARIPLPGSADPKSPEYLGNTYALASVNQKGLALLQRLIADLSAPTPMARVSALRLGYRTGPAGQAASLTLREIDFTDTFLVQSNFSTETRPPQVFMAMESAGAALPDPKQALGFLGKLWSGGVTNSGGYFLCHAGDGSGLPEALFGSGGRATLTLVIGLAHPGTGPAPLAPYVNAVLGSGLTPGEALFVASDSLSDAHPLTLPGQLAIQVTRSRPAEPGAADLGAALDQLYNLYAGRITAIGGTPLPEGEASVFGPDKAGQDSDDLVYRHSFPLVPHAGNLHAVADGGALPEADNPYAAMGKRVDLSLARVDLFGNLWAGYDDGGPLQPTYDDPLIAPTRLPYLAFSYAFAGGKTPRLVVTPVLTPPVYPAGATAEQRKSADLAAYAAAYYQVAAIEGREQVALTLATSLLPGTTLPVEAATLAANLLTAYKAILAAPILTAPPAAPPPEQPLIPLAATLDLAGLAPDLALPLTASLTLARAGPFAPDVPADSAVRSVTVPLPPRTDAGGAQGKPAAPLSLDAFKAGFKAAFAAKDRVLAAGANRTASSADRGRQLWVLRYGKTGIAPRFDTATPPACFAPRPLSNRLISRNVRVPTLAADGTLSPPPGQQVAARDIDLDAVMRRVLAALDGIFSPQLAVPVALVNRDALNRLAATKKAIVEKLVAFVTEIRLDGTAALPAGDAALAAAKDRYRQECLIEMGSFYEMASVAVLDLKTALGGLASPEPMNLFGQPVSGPGPKKAPPSTDTYSLTGGKAAMTPSGGPMAIGLFARNKTLSSTFTADLTFTIGAIEHDLTEIRIGETVYTSGGWLSFLDPPAPLAIGKVEFPIPLRAFPTPPDLGQQQARGLLDPGALPKTAAETLALAKSWVLEGSYRHGFVAQDRVELEVTVNQGDRQGLLFATGLDVIDALIAFDRLLPDLQALFVAQGLAAIRSPDRASNAVLKAALDSFATLAQDIADSGWSPIMPEAFAEIDGTGLVRRSRRFAIEDGVQKPGQPWMTRISISGSGAADLDILPMIGIDGYRTQVAASDASSASYTYLDAQTGKPLTEDQGRALAERRVIVAPAGKGAPFGTALNVIDRQDGTMAMQILRNARFQEAFRYATDWVRYSAPVAPQLDIATPIDIADLAGAPGKPRPLAAHLAALHAALVTGSGTGETLAGMVQLAVGFDLPLTATGPATLVLPPVRLPVLLRLPTAVTLGAPDPAPPAFLDEVAQDITRWLAAMDLTPTTRPDLWAEASLGLDLALFSGATPSGAPILRLRNLRLTCTAIAAQ